MFVIVFVYVFSTLCLEKRRYVQLSAVTCMSEISFVKVIVCFIRQVGLSSYLEQEICTLAFKKSHSKKSHAQQCCIYVIKIQSKQ